MKVVPIRPGVETIKKPPDVDKDLVAHLKALLEAAERGEVQAYVAGYVLREEGDHWYMSTEGWVPQMTYEVRLALHELESPFE